MYYVYLLETNHPKYKYYIGSSPDIKRRLSQHVSGRSKYTRNYLPVKLVYFECYLNKELAIKREKQLKSFSGSYYSLIKRLYGDG